MARPLSGEPLPLDLVNTRWPGGDVLETTDGLAAWLAERGRDDVPAEDPVRRALLMTRQALRDVLEHPHDPAATAAVNAVLARGSVRLVLGPDGPEEHVEVRGAAWRLPWEAARDLLVLLRERPERMHHCGGEGCVLWFLDTTRPGTRRFCSAAGCGNRTKVARHRARRRAADA